VSIKKTANWLVAFAAILAAGTLIYFDPPAPGRAFTKGQISSQQDQVSGANHKRTSGDFNW
jgi:hypothetical protein